MKLIKGTFKDKEPVYFTGISKAAEHIGCVYAAVNAQMHGMTKQTKGWKLEWTEDENILNKFIIA